MTHDRPGGSAPQRWAPQDLPEQAADPYAASGQGQYSGQAPYSGQAQYPGPTASPPTFPGPMPPEPPGLGPSLGHGPPPVPRRTPALAVVGLVLAFLAPLIGLVLSVIAVVRARHDGGGRRLAIAGIVVSVVVAPILAAVAIPVFLHQREAAETAGPRAAFERLETAFLEDDCGAFMATSTASFQAQIDATTCDGFTAFVDSVNAGPVDVGHVPVVGVEVDGDLATVTTVELIVWVEGEPPSEQEFDYSLVRRDGVWLVDGVALGG